MTAPPSTALLPFRTAAELASQTPERPEWIVEGLLAAGSTTELAAKVKVGKTTFAMSMVAAIVLGEPFLGFPTVRSRVLYLTEERPGTMRAVLARVGLTASPDVEILHLTDVPAAAWTDVMALVVRHARDVGARVLVVDTLGRWARLQDENDAAQAVQAMEALEQGAAAGLAVLIPRHDRKSGGEIGDSGRGSSALSGAADILLALRRANVEGHPNRRAIEGVGRFDETPAQLVIEWRDGSYVNLGDSLAVERVAARSTLLDHLPPEPPGASQADLVEQTGLARSTLQRALEDLVAEGSTHVSPAGAGKSGRAKGYWAECPDPRTPGHNGSEPSHDEPAPDAPQVVPTLTGEGSGHNASEISVERVDSLVPATVVPRPSPLEGQHNDGGVL
ncbi:MAG: AAA family ATPase [Chloroflexi bacterium]|nr:AAA family ATPase [Chloroflexota bacterium]